MASSHHRDKKVLSQVEKDQKWMEEERDHMSHENSRQKQLFNKRVAAMKVQTGLAVPGLTVLRSIARPKHVCVFTNLRTVWCWWHL